MSRKCEPGCTCNRHNNNKHARWTGNNASYVAKHKRLNKIRGSAKLHKCVDCNCQAKEWSQIHGTNGLDVYDDYDPRCNRCHIEYDAGGYKAVVDRFMTIKNNGSVPCQSNCNCGKHNPNREYYAK